MRIFILFFSLLVISGEVCAKGRWGFSECEEKSLKAYREYRQALLSSHYEPNKVLDFLRDGYERNILEGKFYKHFMSLRIVETKISKIISYGVKCIGKKSHIKFNTESYNEEYSLRSVLIVFDDDKFTLIHTSDDLPTESLKKGFSFKEMPDDFFDARD